jgi:hypothetical protein
MRIVAPNRTKPGAGSSGDLQMDSRAQSVIPPGSGLDRPTVTLNPFHRKVLVLRSPFPDPVPASAEVEATLVAFPLSLCRIFVLAVNSEAVSNYGILTRKIRTHV